MGLGRRRRTTLLATAIVVALLCALGVVVSPAESSTGFAVLGNRIVAPDGTQFIGRGVNKSGLEWTSGGYDMSFDTFKTMQQWGANFVRIPLSPAFALTRMCTYDRNYMARVDKIVSWTEQLGMLVLLDDHVGTKGLTCGLGRWAGPDKAPDLHNADFVKLLAKRYRTHPWVAIDLYNEPHDITNAVWRDGGMVDGYRAVGMQRLLDDVRATGNTNLVFVSGNTWGNDLSMVADRPLRGDFNVVYAAHSYPFTCGRVVPPNEPYWCDGQQYPPFLDKLIAPAAARRAVMITEFGTQRPIAGEMQAPIDWAEAHHIGWAAWLWAQGKTSDFCLIGPNGEPSISGRPVRDSLAQAIWR